LTYKDSARRRAKKEERERAKLKRILHPSEAQGAANWLDGLAQMMGGRPQVVETAPHARPPRAVVSTDAGTSSILVP
jgi:hypothetical protein